MIPNFKLNNCNCTSYKSLYEVTYNLDVICITIFRAIKKPQELVKAQAHVGVVVCELRIRRMEAQLPCMHVVE